MAGDLAAAGGMADMERIHQRELLTGFREIGSMGLEIIAIHDLEWDVALPAMDADGAVPWIGKWRL